MMPDTILMHKRRSRNFQGVVMQTSVRYRAIRSGRLSRRRRLEAPLIGSEWSEAWTIFPQHPFASVRFVPPHSV
jgi:hypothetical protein